MNRLIEDFIINNNINNCKILIALSGGPDSVALLYQLNSLKIKYNFILEAAYVNHGMRTAEDAVDPRCTR